MTPGEIKALRERMGKTQTEFAAMLGLKPRVVQYWESGGRKPGGAALVLLRKMAETETDPHRPNARS